MKTSLGARTCVPERDRLSGTHVLLAQACENLEGLPRFIGQHGTPMMKRRDFVKSTFGAPIGALAFQRGAFGSIPGRAHSLLEAITWINDRRVAELLDGYRRLLQDDTSGNRGRSGFLTALSAAYCAPSSRYHRSEHLVAPMEEVAATLRQNQYPDGTFDAGNLQSPPDTAFMIEQLGRAQHLLQRQEDHATTEVRSTLQAIIRSAGEALRVGGVHTPNHRWAVCAALAWTHRLYPDQRYVDRVDSWLGESIDQDADGQYSERSPNYSAHVVNPALLDIAVLLDRPKLLDYVRKNLAMTLYHVERNGEVETVASRRQDQAQAHRVLIHAYYRPYRFLAIKDGDHRFAQVARDVEANEMKHLGRYLPDFLLFDELNGSLPTPASPPTDYEKQFSHSDLVRIRRGDITATVFGGSDWHRGQGVWSGLSHNPTFFKYRKGNAILESIRMAPAFFRTGYFRSHGLRAQEGAYHLQEERRVPYHQPLPEEYRNESGDYRMSPDGRFFSKMEFARRPKEYKSLQMNVTVREKGERGRFDMDINVGKHPDVDVAVELCFRKGGQLTGIMPKEEDEGGYVLSEGYGEYRVGADRIRFGPAAMVRPGFTMHGEQYSVHNGGIRLNGYRVYIMGVTPFRHTLRIR